MSMETACMASTMWMAYRYSSTATYSISRVSPTCSEYTFFCYVDPVNEWGLSLPVPKWWRWYDVFRIWQEPKALRVRIIALQVIRLVQERFSVKQRSASKRRMYLHGLYAA
jgi:hypothetical protein